MPGGVYDAICERETGPDVHILESQVEGDGATRVGRPERVCRRGEGDNPADLIFDEGRGVLEPQGVPFVCAVPSRQVRPHFDVGTGITRVLVGVARAEDGGEVQVHSPIAGDGDAGLHREGGVELQVHGHRLQRGLRRRGDGERGDSRGDYLSLILGLSPRIEGL